MTDQQSDHGSVSPAVQNYYSKRILKDFESSTVYYVSCPIKESIPQGEGNNITFTRYKQVAALYKNDTDEFTAQQLYLCAEVVNVTLNERDGFVQLSRTADLTMRNKGLTYAAKKVKTAAGRSLDKLIRNRVGMCVADVADPSSVNMDNLAIDGGSLNSTGITAKFWSHDQAAAGDRFPMYHNKTRLGQSSNVIDIAKSALTIKTIQHGVQELERKDVPPLSSGYYKLITHPTASFQITTSPGFKGWISPTSSEGLKKRPSETGVIAGVMIENTTLAYRYPLSGDTLSTASGAVFCSLLFGDEAYGCTDISGKDGQKGFQFFLKQSGSQTTSDPTNKKRQAGFSILAGAKVMNKSAGLWLISTEVI